MHDAFNAMDKDGSGFLDKYLVEHVVIEKLEDEFQTWTEEHRNEYAEEMREELMRLDTNGDGKIPKKEFIAFCVEQEEIYEKRRAKEVEAYDKSHSHIDK